MFFAKKPRRAALELQLTAMIDIFTMIVIFLIKGTVMGAAELDIPKETQIPRSFSAESLETSPQLLITKDEVRVSNLSKDATPIPSVKLSEFKLGRDVEAASVKNLKATLKTELSKLTAKEREGGILLSVITDQKTPYADVFDVVRVFREAGFETLLFVAESQNLVQSEGNPKAGGG